MLLDTCGQFFDKGSAKRRLDIFLVRLMPYLFCKVSPNPNPNPNPNPTLALYPSPVPSP